MKLSIKILTVLVMCFLTSIASARQWPSQPIVILVGYAAGGAADVNARILSKYLSDELGGVSVIVENKPGATGLIAASSLARAKPDGHTIYYVSSPTMTMAPLLQSNNTVDTRKGFTFIGMTVNFTNLVVLGPQTEIKTFAELIEYAKKNPGQVTYATAGSGSTNHLAAELLQKQAGIQLKHIAFKGSGPALLDVVGGRSTFMFDVVGTATPMIEAGKIRPIAVSSAQRHSKYPDVPTIAESGFPKYDVTGWYGIIAPPNMPKDIQEKLSHALQAVNNHPEYRNAMESSGFTMNTTDAQGFAERVQKDWDTWSDVVSTMQE